MKLSEIPTGSKGGKMLKYTFFSVFGLTFSDVLMFEIANFVVLNIIYLIFFNKYEYIIIYIISKNFF